jgi:hypothetical protein
VLDHFTVRYKYVFKYYYTGFYKGYSTLDVTQALIAIHASAPLNKLPLTLTWKCTQLNIQDVAGRKVIVSVILNKTCICTCVLFRTVSGIELFHCKIWPWVPRNFDARLTALARASSNCKRQTRPLVRNGAQYQQIRNYLRVTKI